MSRYTFTRRERTQCLQFPWTFVPQLNNNALSEGAALNIWPHFLANDALEAFRTQAEDNADDLGGFSTWSEAVQRFLQTYARDEHLQEDVAALNRLVQMDGASEHDFARCLTQAA